jgi:hypothetical protein
MYKQKYIQQINLPKIPKKIINNLPKDINLYKKHSDVESFSRSDSYNYEIDQWCRENIAKDINFGFQIIDGDVPVHIDNRVKIKLFYLISSGGENVLTKFWNNEQTEVLEEYKIPCNEWFLFKANSFHSVENINNGKTRFSLVGKIF